MYVYALELEKGKYYVGKTTREFILRYNEHFNGNGSEWTKIYKPIKVIEQLNSQNNQFEEDNLTKQYMIKYGINNVRGGSYTKIILDDWQIKSLEHEFKGITDICYKCGQNGHFANECGKCNDIEIYLNNFNNESELIQEIKRMESARKQITSEIDIIKKLKYIKCNNNRYSDNKNSEIIIEIEPNIITKYFEEFKKPYNSQLCINIFRLNNDIHLKNSLSRVIDNEFELNPNNMNENIYKIFVNRIKKEKQLKLFLEFINLDINDNDRVLDIIDKRIECLYKKYSELLLNY